MSAVTNLGSFLVGSTRARELRDTRRAWDQTQALWQRSPLATTDERALSISIVRQAMDSAERVPALSILVTIGIAVEELIKAEAIGDLEANWPLIEADVNVAVEFRQMLTRRRRWALDFATQHDAFRRIVVSVIEAFFKGLPEACFAETQVEAGESFEVPLIDLLDDPDKVVDQLFMLPYDEASFRLDLFNRLRDLCAGNLLVASGFMRTDNIRERETKLLRATMQKGKTGAELSELYLDGSPLKALLDIPVPFQIPADLRFEHCHVVGGTGHGKTQLLQKMIHADLVASQRDFRSVIVIDSQGDLINKLTRLEVFSPSMPNSLADRLVIIDPSDVEFPAALNLFDAHLDRVRDYSVADRERVLNGVIELYELFFGAFLGAELTQKQGVIFKYLARLMLAIPEATIHTLMRIMEDGKPYKQYMDLLDGSAKYFFETEFFHPSFAATKKQILRRLWGVLSTPAFERMFSQARNKLDLFEAMNEGKIILVNTAKDLLKRDGSQLLGRFFIAMITQAALERSTLPEHRRNAAFVYVDEAQEYFDDSIETILNQARKYHVGLTLAHQTLDQLSPRLRSALLANTSLKCAGGVSVKDARALADELRTTEEFIESMKRRGPRTEFAVWVKHLTGQAIRLTVPLGFLERQPVLAEEEYDALVSANREKYCGTLAESHMLGHARSSLAETPPPTERHEPPSMPEARDVSLKSASSVTPPDIGVAPQPPPVASDELGKGGPKHRYLQSLVKALGEEQGFRATTEAALQSGDGQVDVLLEREDVTIAFEISVTTPVKQELENVRKCLAAGFRNVALVLAKSKTVYSRYRDTITEGLSESERGFVTFLTPDQIPDYLAGFAAPAPTEKVVRGYKVRVSHAALTPEELTERRACVAKVIVDSMRKRGS